MELTVDGSAVLVLVVVVFLAELTMSCAQY
jgi:hypothetical protein